MSFKGINIFDECEEIEIFERIGDNIKELKGLKKLRLLGGNNEIFIDDEKFLGFLKVVRGLKELERFDLGFEGNFYEKEEENLRKVAEEFLKISVELRCEMVVNG